MEKLEGKFLKMQRELESYRETMHENEKPRESIMKKDSVPTTEYREFKQSVTESIDKQSEDLRYLKINQKDGFDKINRIIEEIKAIRSTEE
jgi:hypothetical protein